MSHYVGPRLIEGQRVVSVNLPEVLLSDADILVAAGLIHEGNSRVCASSEEVSQAIADRAVSLIMVPAQKAKAVAAQGIGLFVNIASFQEMTPALVSEYFDIVRSNAPALFYCCNREEKTLYGGERLVFDEYPWGNPEILQREECPWHQRFYAKRWPFVRRYDGKILHMLVRYTA